MDAAFTLSCTNREGCALDLLPVLTTSVRKQAGGKLELQKYPLVYSGGWQVSDRWGLLSGNGLRVAVQCVGMLLRVSVCCNGSNIIKQTCLKKASKQTNKPTVVMLQDFIELELWNSIFLTQ